MHLPPFSRGAKSALLRTLVRYDISRLRRRLLNLLALLSLLLCVTTLALWAAGQWRATPLRLSYFNGEDEWVLASGSGSAGVLVRKQTTPADPDHRDVAIGWEYGPYER